MFGKKWLTAAALEKRNKTNVFRQTKGGGATITTNTKQASAPIYPGNAIDSKKD